MDWDNEFTLKFLKVYYSEPMIWNPNHCQYRNKVKVHNAWTRIASRLNKTVSELKAKKNSLMASYRSCKRRRQASLRAAAEEDDAYEPTWFAYYYMDNFLGPVYNWKANLLEEGKSTNNPSQTPDEKSVKTEPQSASEPSDNEEREGEYLENTREEVSQEKHHNARRSHVLPMPRRRLQRRQKNEIEIYKTVMDTLANLTNFFSKKTEEDECDLYGKIIASRLRRRAHGARQRLMYEIDGMLLKNLENNSSKTEPTDCDNITVESIETCRP